VAERLGVGPEACLARNRRLVYGRMTGWGQDGPMAPTAGHDIDYIAIGGALWSLGRADSAPVPPLNLVGDFGGGGMLLAFGMVAALLEAARSGEGQVVDAAMVDGSASLMTMIHAFRLNGLWNERRGANMLDTGAPFYEVYETSDGQWMAVGAIESQFYAALLDGLGLADDASLPAQMSRQEWPAMKERFAAVFRSKTRDEWTAVFDGTDACVAPVLSPWEAHTHPTTWRGRPTSRWTGRYSRGRHRGSPARRRSSPSRRRLRAPTRCPGSSSGAWPRTWSRSCASRGRSARAGARPVGMHGRVPSQIFTTGQVMVRVMPSIC